MFVNNQELIYYSLLHANFCIFCLILMCNCRDGLSKVRGSWFLEATDFCHPQARQIHRCIFAPVTSVNAHYYSVLTTPFDMVNAHYVIIDFRAKFFIKIQNQASDTSRSLPSFSSAPFLLRAVPSERLGQVYCRDRLSLYPQRFTVVLGEVVYFICYRNYVVMCL
jgi:hypothetical protein